MVPPELVEVSCILTSLYYIQRDFYYAPIFNILPHVLYVHSGSCAPSALHSELSQRFIGDLDLFGGQEILNENLHNHLPPLSAIELTGHPAIMQSKNIFLV